MAESKIQFLVIPLIFLTCCLNNALIEPLIKIDKGAGSLMTLAMFAFVALIDSRSRIDWRKLRLKENGIPIGYHLGMVLLFFSSSFIANMVFKFHISATLHSIFRSGSMISTALLGFLMGSRYPLRIVMGIVLATLGILVCTLAEGNSQSSSSSQEDQEPTASSIAHTREWIIGIVLLNLALILQTLMGKVQEFTFKKFGKHVAESKFYTHFLSLPIFFFCWDEIIQSARTFNESPVLALDQLWISEKLSDIFGFPCPPFSVPIAWFYLVLYVITQYGCITTVVWLLSVSDSLTVQVTLTTRKFASIMISIFYFENIFTFHHWIGLFLLSLGVYLYSFCPSTKSAPPTDSGAQTKKTQ